MTLIEVLAATVLLSLVLVSVVLARGKSMSQWARANDVLEASRLADAWLTQQWTDPANFPRERQGVLDETRRIHWRTQIISNTEVEVLGGVCVRLEVYEDQLDQLEEPMLAIDLVLPAEAVPQVEGGGTEGVQP